MAVLAALLGLLNSLPPDTGLGTGLGLAHPGPDPCDGGIPHVTSVPVTDPEPNVKRRVGPGAGEHCLNPQAITNCIKRSRHVYTSLNDTSFALRDLEFCDF